MLHFPEDRHLAPEAIDLMRRLMTDAPHRLGTRSVDDIKNHPFFRGIDWKNLRSMKPPYVPAIKSDIDTSNFDTFEEKPAEAAKPADQPWKVKQTDPTFVGYTFKRSKGKDLRAELLGEKLAAAGVAPEVMADAAAQASREAQAAVHRTAPAPASSTAQTRSLADSRYALLLHHSQNPQESRTENHYLFPISLFFSSFAFKTIS